MISLFKKTKLANGKEVKEGDLVYFINSDGVRCEKAIEKRKFNCIHQDTGEKLRKGSLFFWNIGFKPSDYKNADLV
jgi:hypothetical protein